MKRISFIVLIFLPAILLFTPPLANLARADGISYAEVLNFSGSCIAPSNLTWEMTTANWDLQLVKRGCCSWHGGVCGCEGGRVLCCDGTLSPSCTCYSNTK